MESGTIVRWLKSEGDRVERGEPLYELDTEKVTQEVEAEASGVLLKIAVSEGEVDVGRTIAFIGEAGEDVGDGGEPDEGPTAAEEAEPAEGAEGADEQAEEGSRAPARDEERERGRAVTAQAEDTAGAQIARARGQTDGGRVKASPLARRIARERGVDIAALQGTGP